MRLDKPIGIYLLMWPTLWALLIAAEGMPSWHIFSVFMAGTVLMRSAGCIINDYADRKVDGAVKRTANRPLATGEISAKQAIALFVVLISAAFALVITLNKQTVILSFAALALAACYPFMKRFTHLPQVVLGAAFGWSIPMVFMAVQQQIPVYAWWLYLANLLWTVVYDTFYAMVDRDDDLKIGVKSTAILFGTKDRLITGLLQTICIAIFIYLGSSLQFSWPYYCVVGLTVGMFIYQQWLIQDRNRDACFAAFLHNHQVGCVICMGIAGQYLL